jgi:methyltransferase (TIGR00027 family)
MVADHKGVRDRAIVRVSSIPIGPSGKCPMDLFTTSRTALATSLMRALHSRDDPAPLLDDPWGDRLVPESEREGLRQQILARMDSDARAAALRAPELILDDYLRASVPYPSVVTRSRYTEDALRKAVEKGTHQYVLIGAGFDSFVLRRPAFCGDIEIFEIDHPATQTLKLQRIKECGVSLPGSVHFVAADFERETLETALSRSSFRRDETAFFSWLGVTSFLTREVNLATLHAVATCGARGSELVFTYVDQIEFNSGTGSRFVRDLNAGALASMGEPMISGFDPKEIANDLRHVGLECGFLRLRTGIPIDCGQSFQSIADSIPMIADSSPTDGF